VRFSPSKRTSSPSRARPRAYEYAREADAMQTPLLSSLLRALLLHLERIAVKRGAKVDAPPQLSAFQTELERRHADTRAVDDYARTLGITPRALNALTRRHFRTSAKQTIDARALLELKRLLAYTALSVKELSARFRFGEPTNLVKFFRHHTGQTPIDFRRMARAST
jgi:AraC family transcriptional activator of pobA